MQLSVQISSFQDYCLSLLDVWLDQPSSNVKDWIFLQFDYLAIVGQQLSTVL